MSHGASGRSGAEKRLGSIAWGVALSLCLGACSGDKFRASTDAGGGSDTGSGGAIGAGGPRPTDAGEHERDRSLPGKGTEADASAPDGEAPSSPDAGEGEPAPSDGGRFDSSVSPEGASLPLGFCEETKAAFCADFDRVALVSDGWTTVDVKNGTVAFDVESFTSPKRGMNSRMALAGPQNPASALLTKRLTSSATHSLGVFSLKVSHLALTRDASIIEVARIMRNQANDGVALIVDGAARWAVLLAAGNALTSKFDLPAAPPYGRFVRVSMDVVWAPKAGSVHVAIDGVTVVAQDGIVTADEQPTSSLGLSAGLHSIGGNTAEAEISLDDVTFDSK